MRTYSTWSPITVDRTDGTWISARVMVTSKVDVSRLMVSAGRDPVRQRLVRIDASAETDQTNHKKGAAPKDGAKVHVGRLRRDRTSAAQPDARVPVCVVDAHLEVQVRPGRPSGRAFERDGRAARHDHAPAQPRRLAGQVAVHGGVTVAVHHQDHVAVAD